MCSIVGAGAHDSPFVRCFSGREVVPYIVAVRICRGTRKGAPSGAWRGNESAKFRKILEPKKAEKDYAAGFSNPPTDLKFFACLFLGADDKVVLKNINVDKIHFLVYNEIAN